MKRFAFLLFLCAAALAGLHLRTLHGDVPTSTTAPPSRPRHWTISVPQWHPVTESQWARMSSAERFISEQEARQLVAHAATDAGGSSVVPGDAGRPVVDLVVTLARGQRTPSPASIWPAIERALEAGAAIRAGRGDVRFTRGVSKGEYGVDVTVKEIK